MDVLYRITEISSKVTEEAVCSKFSHLESMLDLLTGQNLDGVLWLASPTLPGHSPFPSINQSVISPNYQSVKSTNLIIHQLTNNSSHCIILCKCTPVPSDSSSGWVSADVSWRGERHTRYRTHCLLLNLDVKMKYLLYNVQRKLSQKRSVYCIKQVINNLNCSICASSSFTH